jgi:hypothetical protein
MSTVQLSTRGGTMAAALGGLGRPPYVEDFGGGTDRTGAQNVAAANACLAAHGEVNFGAGTYLCNGPILFAPTNTSGQVAAVVRGAGNAATILLQQDHNADTLQFLHADRDAHLRIRPQVRDLTIRYVGATTAATGAAIRARGALGGLFENLSLDGASFGIVAERCGQCWFKSIYFETLSRATGNRATAHLVFDHNPAATGANGFGFGHFLSNIEAHGAGPGALRNILIRCLDGLYISNSHFGWAERHIEISPDGTGGRTAVFDLRCANVYFDMGGPAGNIIDRHILLRAPGASPTIQIRGLHFAQCLFRGDNTARAFAFDQAEGALNGAQFVQSVKFTGCEFRLFNNPAVDFTPPAGFDAVNRLREITVDGCTHSLRSAVDPANPAILVAGQAVSLNGNVYAAGLWRGSGPRPIRVLSASRNVSITDEVFAATAERPAWENVLIDEGAVNVRISGLVGGGAASASEIVERGSTAAGEWVRYTDGRQVVTRYVALTGQNVSTAYGTLFQSGNLLPDDDRDFPRPFLLGTTPLLTMQARIGDAPTFTLVGGPPLHNAWPALVRAAHPTALTGRTITLHLRAEGRWR